MQHYQSYFRTAVEHLHDLGHPFSARASTEGAGALPHARCHVVLAVYLHH